MISAFGVEHTIKKSMLPGGRFVPAKLLSSKGRAKNKMLTAARRQGATPGEYIPGTPVKNSSAKGKQLYPEEGQSPMGMKSKIHTDVLGPEHEKEVTRGRLIPQGSQILGASKPNGRGGGIMRMNSNASPELQAATYKHELAHLKPKRNPYHFADRMQDQTKLGREEGRADYLGNDKKTPGRYPGGQDFQRGYNDVQNRMHVFRKPRTFKVNRKGEAVQKSAFGIAHTVVGF